MPTFRYQGRKGDGQTVSGTVDADSRLLATIRLRQQGLSIETLKEDTILDIALESEPTSLTPRGRMSMLDVLHPISAGSLARFWNQFAQLMHAGVSIYETLTTLQGRVPRRIGSGLAQMAQGVGAGHQLCQEAALHPGIFPRHVVGMLRAAQSSGDLEAIGRDLADQYEQDFRMWLRLLPGKIYFAIVAVLCVLIAPFPTYVISAPDLNTGLHNYLQYAMAHLFPWMAAAVVGLIVLRGLLNLPGIKQVKDSVLYALPVINTSLVITGRWRFMRCLQILMRAGVPLPEAVETASDAFGNAAMARPYLLAAEQMRTVGGGIAALAQVRSLPADIRNILLTAGQAGTYDEALEALASRAAEERKSLMGKLIFANYALAYVIMVPLVAMVVYLGYRNYMTAILDRFNSPEWMP